MTEARTLLIYGEPDMSRIKEAKASMGLDFLVVPRDAHDGLNGRVLAYGEVPPFLCDYALVGGKTPQEGLVAALKWVLLGGDDPRATPVTKTLSNIFGVPVKELTSEEVVDYDRDEKLKKVSFRLKLQEKGDSRDR